MSDNKRALLIVAHGSRREASNDEIRKLAEIISKQAGNRFLQVESAFLELAVPSIPDGIERCILAGAAEVIVFPYFLAAGRHVAEDIPAAVEIKRTQYPHIPITIAAYLGADKRLPELMLNMLA